WTRGRRLGGPGSLRAPRMGHDKAALDSLRIDRAARPRARSPVPWALAFVAVAAAVAAYWWFNRPAAKQVRTAAATSQARGGDRTMPNAWGWGPARRAAPVSSKVTGKVVEVLIEEGKQVEAGQVLARLDSSNLEKSLGLAEAQLEASRRAQGETKANL